MPYTPPTQRSPSTSQPGSPAISRTGSYAHNVRLAASGTNGVPSRPSLPRSISSTTYLQKHRRSPSISDHQARSELAAKHDSVLDLVDEPVHQVLSGMMRAEKDAHSDSSSDEDRGRPIKSEDIKKLEEALAKLQAPVIRGHSPTRECERGPKAVTCGSASAPNPGSPDPAAIALIPALNAAARRILHVRSSSEIQLSKPGRISTPNAPTIASDDSDDDDDLHMKPPLLRKKSGELVKPALRPSSSRRRPSSMPGTPTYHKAVHFNDNMEQVRHFLQVDKPSAVSASSSPVEMYESESEYPFGSTYSRDKSTIVEWDIKTSNFPVDTFERQSAPVRVDRIFLTQDSKTLVGTVAVANIAFQKHVIARFTLDYWKTTSEVVAEYNHDVRKQVPADGMDRFNFNIKLADQANLENKTLLLCVRYTANGHEYWDNNSNMNYQVDFVKTSKPKPSQKQNAGVSPNASLGSVPRSRHTSPSHGRSARTQPASPDDDFARRFDPRFQFGVSRVDDDLDTNATPIRLRQHQRQPRKGSVFPEEARHNKHNVTATSPAFSTRYDFSASLSAALTNAQHALGDRSGPKVKAGSPTFTNDAPVESPVAAAPAAPVTTTPVTDAPKPGVLTTATDGRPGLQSAEYNDLIQKYCFFGADANSKTSSPLPTGTPDKVPASSTTAPSASVMPSSAITEQKGTVEESTAVYGSAASSADSSALSSMQSSGSNSPTPQPEATMSLFDGSNDSRHHSRTPSTYSNRSSSSSNFSITARAGSPVPFQNHWGSAGQMGSGLFESHGVVASHG